MTAPLTTAAAAPETVAELVERLGGVPLHRIRMQPVIGTATEADVLAREPYRLYELVEGTLVEKGLGYTESLLAARLIESLNQYIRSKNLGIVTSEAGMYRLFVGLIRIPDVAYTSWDRMPGRRRPTAPVPALAPDLAVEVLSASNTDAEMARKCDEYFRAGVRLVWLADPAARTVAVNTAAYRSTLLTEADTLDGGDVLPGFVLPLRDWFAELDRQG